MLPVRSCCMIEFLPDRRQLVGRERAADLPEHLGRGDRVRPRIGVSDQVREGPALVGVGDRAAQAAPQPLDAVGLRVVGRGVVSRPGLIIVWSCPISQSFSYSAGGIFPQAEWSLSLLYQDTHSAVATVTSPASCHGPSRLISSFLYREFTASAAALS